MIKRRIKGKNEARTRIKSVLEGRGKYIRQGIVERGSGGGGSGGKQGP